MGAAPFHVYGEGADFDAAFQRAYTQAGFEDGHSYSGTLSSKSGAVIAERTPLPMAAATMRADDLMHGETGDARALDKWGPALALPVTDAAVARRTRRVTVRTAEEWDLDGVVRTAVELAPGEMIDAISYDAIPDLTYTVTARTTEGPAVTRYRIIGQAATYVSQAEARRALVELMKSGARLPADAMGIEAVRTRADGSPLVVAERTPRPRAVKATVTIITPDRSAPIAGWLFFGYAPS